MDEESIKRNVISSLFWKYMQMTGTQGIQFIVQIVLARLLLPEDYGLIAIIIIFIAMANVFVESGLSTALIQKKDVDDVDLSSVFYLSLFIATLLYIVLFFTAYLVGDFYQKPLLIPIMRVSSLSLFFGAFNSIQNAVVARNLEFKKLFFSSTGAIIVSGIVGIYMAYKGYGVWSLVIQQLSNQLLAIINLWFTVRWRPQRLFSIKRAKKLFSFGWKLLIASLINTLFVNLRSLTIGKIYNPEMLGFYNRGQQFPAVVIKNINGTIQSVMFPVLSSKQDNVSKVKDMVRRSLATTCFIIFPVMIGLLVIAEPLVKLLLTDKWLPCVPFLQIYCIIYLVRPLNNVKVQAINALGRSDISLKLEIMKKIIDLFILGVTVFYGIYAIAIGGVISVLIVTMINTYPSKQLFGYSYKEQLKDIVPSFLLTLVMGATMYSITFIGSTVWTTLVIQVMAGILLYIGLAWIFKIECFIYLLKIIGINHTK